MSVITIDTDKDPVARRDWKQKEKGATEDEMVRLYHRLSGHEFEQTLGDSEGHGNLSAAIHGAAKSQTRLNDWNQHITVEM